MVHYTTRETVLCWHQPAHAKCAYFLPHAACPRTITFMSCIRWTSLGSAGICCWQIVITAARVMPAPGESLPKSCLCITGPRAGRCNIPGRVIQMQDLPDPTSKCPQLTAFCNACTNWQLHNMPGAQTLTCQRCKLKAFRKLQITTQHNTTHRGGGWGLSFKCARNAPPNPAETCAAPFHAWKWLHPGDYHGYKGDCLRREMT